MANEFNLLADGDYEFVLYQREPIDADEPCYAFIVSEYTDSWGDSPEFEHHVSVVVASPKMIDDSIINDICDEIAISRDEWDNAEPITQANELRFNGYQATLWQKGGNNRAELIREAKKELRLINVMFGFYMDKPQNMIGTSGWDFMRGDILAGH